jgi:hypothetical protein
MGEIEHYKKEVTSEKQDTEKIRYNSIASGYREALQVVDDIVLKNYISNLSSMPVIPISNSMLENNIVDNIRLFKITEMVYEKEEFATYKFASVFNSLATTESAIFIIIDSNGMKTDFYMGIRSLDSDRTASSLKDTVENAMKGQFPGIKIKDDYTVEKIQELLGGIKHKSISSVTCVANSRATNIDNNQSFVQGLEKLILSMQGEKYTGIVIANGTTPVQLRKLRREYENIYTKMSAFKSTQVTYSSNKSINFSFAETNSTNKSINKTITSTETEGETISSSKSYTHGTSEESMAGKTLKGVAGAASILGASLAPITGGTSLVVGGVFSGAVSMLGSSVSKNVSDSETVGKSNSKNTSKSTGISDGLSEGTSYGNTKTGGYANGMTEGMTLTLHDKTIEGILERIDKQLKRIDEFESLGMYECAAYFLSENQYVSEVAASTYKALMRGENSGVEVAATNSWGNLDIESTEMISKYVTNLIHPVFKYEGSIGQLEVTPCSLVSGNELAIHMGLPRRSVCGLPVIEHADFGKEVVTYNSENKGSSIKMGKVFNMGSECGNDVRLDMKSLSMHTFITGSTGSGKSNTVYELARQLDNAGVNFMVIEPTKGEYKNVLALSPNVKVYGTNPEYTDLLKINPFKFSKGIHVLEHADRLVEIFNVCWPMYAAMPAILKDAVLQAYKKSGWDLTDSTNIYSELLFPTFQDLLYELVDVISKSAYSEEVKSNYVGSLITRIKSLTNGLNGLIFSAQEVDNEELFDKKVIVDLSRIGSLETKSLIMGILIMKLSEHRITNSTGMNTPLNHVTILEEAHHILKRTSTEQSTETSNMTGKSVEMISNAISEMRTYGEGFLIVDQSPSAVDISVIRNTNTKIIMRLPDEQDRRIAGKSAGLKDEQLDEIAKLPRGVAVVYQNDWVEPVLCKVHKYSGKEGMFSFKNSISRKVESMKEKSISELNILKALLDKVTGEKLDMNISDLSKTILEADLKTETKKSALIIISGRINHTLESISSVVFDMVCNEKTINELGNASSMDDWEEKLILNSNSCLKLLPEEYQYRAIECVVIEQAKLTKEPELYIDNWKKYKKGNIS